jgi:hypothetical protein
MPHCCRKSKFGMGTFSMLTLRILAFNIRARRSVSNEPSKTESQKPRLPQKDLVQTEFKASGMRRAICGCDKPRSMRSATRGARVFSTLEQRNSGSQVTRAAMSERGMSRLERKARTTSDLDGDLRWKRLMEALRAWAHVRLHLAMR